MYWCVPITTEPYQSRAIRRCEHTFEPSAPQILNSPIRQNCRSRSFTDLDFNHFIFLHYPVRFNTGPNRGPPSLSYGAPSDSPPLLFSALHARGTARSFLQRALWKFTFFIEGQPLHELPIFQCGKGGKEFDKEAKNSTRIRKSHYERATT